MALTEEEKTLVKAYNIGYLMSSHEPALLDKIIKDNSKNEFIKAMQIGRDHQQFHVGIPRKDYTREFKNGFYNGRTLAEHQPDMIDRLITGKGLNKNYKKGLESAKKEFAIRSIEKKMDAIPKIPAKDLRNDQSFQRGFNIGYRLGETNGFPLRYAQTANEKYSNYIEGMKAGQDQYNYDLTTLREKDPTGRIFPEDPKTTIYQNSLIDHKLMSMDNISNNQFKSVERQESFPNVPPPKWLQKKEPGKIDHASQKRNDKGIDHDR